MTSFNIIHRTNPNEAGHALIIVLLVFLLSTILVIGILDSSSTSLRSSHARRTITQSRYQIESAIRLGTDWLRDNSQNMVSPFSRETFYSSFSPSEPTIGRNDLNYQVLTKLKILNSTHSAILSNNQDLATPKFPRTSHIVTNKDFDPITNFEADFENNTLARITLIDALPVVPEKNYGPPPAAAPQTDFYPIYRIDVMGGIDSGHHASAYITSEFEYLKTLGFYGRESLSIRSRCDSYKSSEGKYSKANRQPNCKIRSNNAIKISNTSIIYGSADSNGKLDVRGKVCADFKRRCPNEGETCSGVGCQVSTLEPQPSWKELCPAAQPNITVQGDYKLTIEGDQPISRCWKKITIKKKGTLNLVSTNAEYYIETIELEHPTRSKITFKPDNPEGTVTLSFAKLLKEKNIDGRRFLNSTNNPSRAKLFYHGQEDLKISGNKALYFQVVAPNASIKSTGKHNFFGAIAAKSLDISKKVKLHYDEDLGTDHPIDMKFRIRQITLHPR